MDKSLMYAKEYNIISFQSTHHALAAEKTLQKENISQVVIPTPKEISASCGLTLKIWPADFNRVIVLLKERGIVNIKAYEKTPVDNRYNQLKINS